jgi:UPF0716 family protein affecting phage T7 exclusion
MQAVLEIFLLAVGVPCIIVLIAAENAIVTLIVMIYAVLIALPTFMPTLLCVLLFIPCVVGAVADHFLNGMIRVLARTENHPEAWWYNTAFEYYNVNLRALLSFSTCSNGYSKNIFYQEKRVSECSVSGEYAHARLSYR